MQCTTPPRVGGRGRAVQSSTEAREAPLQGGPQTCAALQELTPDPITQRGRVVWAPLVWRTLWVALQDRLSIPGQGAVKNRIRSADR
jgi:hypothetical protein